MTGIINVTSQKPLVLDDMKAASKKLGVTINDMVLCALTTSLKVIFKEQNDDTKDITICIPANIRFKFYARRENVKLENKFAAMTIRAPLTENMESAYKPIKQVTK